MNVTLSVDDKVLERARELARRRGSTLNQLVRDYLQMLTSSQGPSAALAELEELWEEGRTGSGDWTWNREELQDRPLLR